MIPKRKGSLFRQRTGGAMTAVRQLFLLLVFLLAGSCGTEDGSGTIGGTLLIDISIPSASVTYTLPSSAGSIEVGGYVSESPYGKVQESVCNCAGFACFFDPQCTTMYFPRVDVTVQNLETGQSVAATLSNNSYSQSESGYSWHATVSPVGGNNRVTAQASDGIGYQGSDSITIQNP